MVTKKKKISLDAIPDVIEKAIALIDNEINILGGKDSLSTEDSKNLVSFVTILSGVYKEYKAEVKAIKEEIKGTSKEDLLRIIKTDNK